MKSKQGNYLDNSSKKFLKCLVNCLKPLLYLSMETKLWLLSECEIRNIKHLLLMCSINF